MSQFVAGKVYPFQVLEIREEKDEKQYIYLSDGSRDTYRVAPFDYQLEWERSSLPAVINCYVVDIDIWGMPYLLQVRAEVLRNCYTDLNSVYPFKVLAIREDVVTQKKYYELKDSFGIKHRYYPQPQETTREVSDIFSLVVAGIEEKPNNKAYLQLKPVANPVVAEVVVESQAKASVPDIRKESPFGYEDDSKEFKSSIAFPAGTIEADIDRQMLYIAKTIAGFQNKNGGTLYLGVNDSGFVSGIHHDYQYLNSSKIDTFAYQANQDGYENKLRTSIKRLLGTTANSNITCVFKQEEALTYCIVKINKVLKPVFVNETKLYQRAGNTTQVLKGDEITWFIEERFRERHAFQYNNEALWKHSNAEPEEVPEEKIPASTQTIPVVVPETPTEIEEPSKQKKIWYYITFYQNGDWSFQDNPVATKEVVKEFAIEDWMKKERLMMVYANGCINVVIPNDIINPKTNKGRKLKTKGKRYNNGWNTNATLQELFIASSGDLIAIKSKQKDGTEWIKLHKAEDISVHENLHLKGNTIVNQSLEATLVKAYPLAGKYTHLVSSLVLKKYQTTLHLGVKTTDRSNQKTIKLLEQLSQPSADSMQYEPTEDNFYNEMTTSNLSARATNIQNAITALIKAGYIIQNDTPKEKDVDLVVYHSSKPKEILKLKVCSRMIFFRRLTGSGKFIVFTYELTQQSYLYPHDTLLKAFPNILKTESWLSALGMYHFPKISEEAMELIKKYRL